MSGARRDPLARLSRGGLWLLSLLYGSVIAVYRGMFALGVLRTRRLPCKVISVGNLTVGGTGKSQLVWWIAGELRDQGERVCILSYGYRARSDTPVTVVSDGTRRLVSAAESGDEAAMLADQLRGVPILIGKRRTESGQVAVERFGATVCLLDDGFQYWRLHRDLNIAVVNVAEPFGHGYLLPRGLLREGPRALGRADAVVFTGASSFEDAAVRTLRERIARVAPPTVQAAAVTAPARLRGLSGDCHPLESLRGRLVAALSSLGRPQGFEATLRSLGAEVRPVRFPDHHPYTAHEVRAVAEEAQRRGETLVTTAKDAVKILPEWLDSPLLVLEVALRMDDPQGAFHRLLHDSPQSDKTVHAAQAA